jgi:hypothetical protein
MNKCWAGRWGQKPVTSRDLHDMSEKSKLAETHEDIKNPFRAFLQTAITAEQFGQRSNFAAIPGAKAANYCVSLAELPDNALARELAAPVWAILREIEQSAMLFYRPLYHKKVTDPKKAAEYERILWQLDFAIALIQRHFNTLVRFRAKRTKCPDLLVDHLCAMLRGEEASELLRKYQKEFPDDCRDESGRITDGGFPEMFAWDTYVRVEALDRFAEAFPEEIKLAAKIMHGWPMLAHRHTKNRKRFETLAARLELGVDYPLDASDAARFRPNSPFVRYLDPLISKLAYVRSVTMGDTYETPEKETESLRRWWWDIQEERPTEEEIAIARVLRKLPPLTKLTANEWAEKAVVPIILACDARDWKNCEEPALKQIAKQKGVKSRATFKSRLLSAVSANLRRLARPA